MRFTEDEGVRAHETYGAHLSKLTDAARVVFARQQGNLKARDRQLIAEFEYHHAAALAELEALRRELIEARRV